MRCYDEYHERLVTKHGCSYARAPAVDQAAWEATPKASACPRRGAPAKAFTVGGKGAGGPCVCRGHAEQPPPTHRPRCLFCEGLSPLAKEE